MPTATTIAIALAAVVALVWLVAAVAYNLGRAAGFDDGIAAIRRIEQSTQRGAPGDRAS